MTCDRLQTHLVAYAERSLSPAETQVVEKHIATCADCRRKTEEYRRLVGGLKRTFAEEKLPGNFTDAILKKLDSRAAETAFLLDPLPERRRYRLWGWVGAAAAAVLVLSWAGYALLQHSTSRVPVTPGKDVAELPRETPRVAEQHPSPASLTVQHPEPLPKETAPAPLPKSEEPAHVALKTDVPPEPEKLIPTPEEKMPAPEPVRVAEDDRTPPVDAVPTEEKKPEVAETPSVGTLEVAITNNPKVFIETGSYEDAVRAMDIVLKKWGPAAEPGMLTAAFRNPEEDVALAAVEKSKSPAKDVEDLLFKELASRTEISERLVMVRSANSRAVVGVESYKLKKKTTPSSAQRRKIEKLLFLPVDAAAKIPEGEMTQVAILDRLKLFQDAKSARIVEQYLDDERLWMKQAAIRTFTAFPAEVVRSGMDKIGVRSVEDTDPGIRMVALRALLAVALADVHSKGVARNYLQQSARGEKNPAVKQEAVRLLEKLRGSERRPDLRIWKWEEEPDVSGFWNGAGIGN